MITFIAVVFFVSLIFFLNWFTRYFNAINEGIEALLHETAEEINLPSEMAVTERKLNTVKQTLKQRELAVQLAEQRKNDLVMYLAHDIKTPLTSVIIGKSGDVEITAYDIAAQTGTITNEILSRLGNRLDKIIV